MKKTILISLLIALPLFFVAMLAVNGAGLNIRATIPTTTLSPCNGSCVSAVDCANGLSCISHICRNSSYPDSATCSCEVNCGGGTTVTCNQTCDDSNTCSTGLVCYNDPILAQKVCRNPVVVSSLTCSQEGSVILNIKSFPEKRTPYLDPNYTLPGILEIRASDNTFITSTAFFSSQDGWAAVGVPQSAFATLPGIYNLELKGISHLLKATTSVNIINKTSTGRDGNNEVDFTLYPTRYFSDCPGRCFEAFNSNPINGALLAGDAARPKNNYVNSLDFSAMAGDLYLNNQDADLNWDGQVNSLDFSIAAINVYRQGE